MQTGVNADPKHRYRPADIAAGGFQSVRFPVLYGTRRTAFVAACERNGMEVLPVFVQESMSKREQRSRDYCSALLRLSREYPGLDLLQVGNEPDNNPELPGSESSWCMEPAEFSRLLRTARDVFPRATLIAGGMVSGQPWWLGQVDLSPVDLVAVHPYGKTAFSVGNLLEGYRQYGKPLAVTELGGSHADFRYDERARAQWHSSMLTALRIMGVWMTYVFCYSDAMAPYGLLNGALEPYESYAAVVDSING